MEIPPQYCIVNLEWMPPLVYNKVDLLKVNITWPCGTRWDLNCGWPAAELAVHNRVPLRHRFIHYVCIMYNDMFRVTGKYIYKKRDIKQLTLNLE